MTNEMLRSIEWDKTAGNSPVESQDLDHPYVRLSKSLIDEEVNGVNELLDSYFKGDLRGVLDGLGDTLKVVCQMCFALNVDPNDLLREVNDSNFSKFCKTEMEAIDSVHSYKNDTRYKKVFYEKIGDWYVIKGFKTNQNPAIDTPKVLKAIGFREPDVTNVKGIQ